MLRADSTFISARTASGCLPTQLQLQTRIWGATRWCSTTWMTQRRSACSISPCRARNTACRLVSRKAAASRLFRILSAIASRSSAAVSRMGAAPLAPACAILPSSAVRQAIRCSIWVAQATASFSPTSATCYAPQRPMLSFSTRSPTPALLRSATVCFLSSRNSRKPIPASRSSSSAPSTVRTAISA